MPETKATIVVPTAPPNSDYILLLDGDVVVTLRKSAVDAYHGIEHVLPGGPPQRFRVIVRGGFQFFVNYSLVAEEQLINALAKTAWTGEP